MALLGQAAVAMWWNIAAEHRDEFLDWHTHEHLPERLRIAGFRRGARWAGSAQDGGFFVMYELAERATLLGDAYLERLNNPTPWSRRMMPHHADMMRTLADVVCTHGAGVARCVLTLRLSPAPGKEDALRTHFRDALAGLAVQRGVSGAHLLEAAPVKAGSLTEEQRIRGADASADWIVLVMGYDPDALQAACAGLCAPRANADWQGPIVTGVYELSGTLTAGEA